MRVRRRWPGTSASSTAAYGRYYKVARAFVHLISHPEAMRLCVSLGMRSELLMNQLLRIMSNLMRPDAAGPAEFGFRAMELISRVIDLDDLERPGGLRVPGASEPAGVTDSLGSAAPGVGSAGLAGSSTATTKAAAATMTAATSEPEVHARDEAVAGGRGERGGVTVAGRCAGHRQWRRRATPRSAQRRAVGTGWWASSGAMVSWKRMLSAVPSTATPSAPPTCIDVSLVAEPTPASARGSEPMIDSVSGARANPTPSPTRANQGSAWR